MAEEKDAAEFRPVVFRLRTNGLTWLDDKAHEHRRSRSDVIRAAISIAAKHPAELDARLKDFQ